jgi:hypothetical protein
VSADIAQAAAAQTQAAQAQAANLAQQALAQTQAAQAQTTNTATVATAETSATQALAADLARQAQQQANVAPAPAANTATVASAESTAVQAQAAPVASASQLDSAQSVSTVQPQAAAAAAEQTTTAMVVAPPPAEGAAPMPGVTAVQTATPAQQTADVAVADAQTMAFLNQVTAAQSLSPATAAPMPSEGNTPIAVAVVPPSAQSSGPLAAPAADALAIAPPTAPAATANVPVSDAQAMAPMAVTSTPLAVTSAVPAAPSASPSANTQVVAAPATPQVALQTPVAGTDAFTQPVETSVLPSIAPGPAAGGPEVQLYAPEAATAPVASSRVADVPAVTQAITSVPVAAAPIQGNVQALATPNVSGPAPAATVPLQQNAVALGEGDASAPIAATTPGVVNGPPLAVSPIEGMSPQLAAPAAAAPEEVAVLPTPQEAVTLTDNGAQPGGRQRPAIGDLGGMKDLGAATSIDQPNVNTVVAATPGQGNDTIAVGPAPGGLGNQSASVAIPAAGGNTVTPLDSNIAVNVGGGASEPGELQATVVSQGGGVPLRPKTQQPAGPQANGNAPGGGAVVPGGARNGAALQTANVSNGATPGNMPNQQAPASNDVANLPEAPDVPAASYDAVADYIAQAAITAPKPCTAAIPVRNASGQTLLQAYALNPVATASLYVGLNKNVGNVPFPTVSVIGGLQCSALEFISKQKDYPRLGLGLELASQTFVNGTQVIGTVSNVAGRVLHLLVVDDDGQVLQIPDEAIKVDGNKATFALTVGITGTTDTSTTSVLMAVATPAPLAAMKEDGDAINFFADLRKELDAGNVDARFGVAAFTLTRAAN